MDMMNVKNILTGRTGDLIRKKSFSLVVSVMRLAFLIIVGYIVLYPILFMATNAIKTPADFLDVSHTWLPMEVTFDNFADCLRIMQFPDFTDGVSVQAFGSLGQTFVLQMVSAGLEIVVCSFIAYGFARFKFKGKGVATVLLILSLLIPVEMYSLGLSVNYRILGIFDTPFAYWLPALFGVGIRSGMLIYIYQQFFIGLPHELEDAAYVDGAGPVRTYFSIALPSSSVVIVTNAVLAIIWYWNESYLAELCFMNENRPLSVLMNLCGTLLATNGINAGQSMYTAYMSACCLLFLAIPLIFYMIIQRKFVKSIDRVGITG